MNIDGKAVFNNILIIKKIEDDINKLDAKIVDINNEIKKVNKLKFDFFVLLEEDIKDLSLKDINKYLPKGYKDFLGKIVCARPLLLKNVEDTKLLDKGYIVEVPGYGYIHEDIYFECMSEDRIIQTRFYVDLDDVEEMNKKYKRFNF